MEGSPRYNCYCYGRWSKYSCYETQLYLMKYIFPVKNSYLDFQRNLLQASVKNFQIVHESDTDYIIMQVSMLWMVMIVICFMLMVLVMIMMTMIYKWPNNACAPVWAGGWGHLHNGLQISNVRGTSFRSRSLEVKIAFIIVICFFTSHLTRSKEL